MSSSAVLDRPKGFDTWVELQPVHPPRHVRLLERPVEVVDGEDTYRPIRLAPYQGDLDVI